VNSQGNNGGKPRYSAREDANTNAGRWTPEEHDLFMKGLELHGREWKKIASMIKSRTVVQIRTHAQKYFQKLARNEGRSEPPSSSGSMGPRKSHRTNGRGGGDDEYGDDGDEDDGLEGNEDRFASQHEHRTRGAKGQAIIGAAARAGQRITAAQRLALSTSASDPAEKRLKLRALSIDAGISQAAGGITPRTVAAATILLAPRYSGESRANPATSEWMARNQPKATEVLGQPRRMSPRLTSMAPPPAWTDAMRASPPQR